MKRNTVFPSRGRCIYCPDFSQLSRFTVEHIIPEAIGGQLKVDKACCRTCQHHIGKFEGRLNNGIFAGVRSLLRISGKGKPRDKVSVAWPIGDGSTLKSVYISNNHHPGYLMLEGLVPPGLQTGTIDRSPGPRRANVVVKSITADPRGPAFELFSFDGYADFMRLLAKIAHSYWIGERGHENFQPYLTEFILGKVNFDHALLIGRNDQLNSHIDDLHHLVSGTEIRNGIEYCYVDISLFSCFPVYNGYRVYVGNFGNDRIIQWKMS